MSRYRKIEVRTWSDEKFRALSALPPSGQSLWFFLLAGPHTGPVPGLFRAGRAAMAEELDWTLEAFDEAFGEAFQQGMAKADFKAKLVWLPNALKHNRPESPNVVKSWRSELDLLPECDLKREAIAYIREYLSGLGNAYVAALFGESTDDSEAIGKPSSKASVKPSRKAMSNQEQEQEQEQEKVPARKRANPKTSIPDAFGISERVKVWADQRGFRDLPRHLDHFIGSAKARDYRYVDWDEAFMNAIRSDWAKVREGNKGASAISAFDYAR